NTKKTLQIYWQHILNYKISGILLIIAIIGWASIDVIIPLYLKDFFNALASNEAKKYCFKKFNFYFNYYRWFKIFKMGMSQNL
ncbi:MAG: hypothetical protein ABIE46_03625, partial [Patescibacteria group bacterium]